MSHLLDTCALLWLVNDDPQLSAPCREACATAFPLCVSAATAWELALKHRKGRLHLPFAPIDWWNRAVEAFALRVIPISAEIAMESTALPDLHADPADRLLVATARRHQLILLTPDDKIRRYPDVRTLW